MEMEGDTYARPEDRPTTLWNAVSPGFFDVLGLGVRSGRSLEAGDVRGAPRVAVVSESWVRQYSPDAQPLGRTFRLLRADSTAWITVVGVVADAKLGGGQRARDDRVYLPLDQVDAGYFIKLLLFIRVFYVLIE